LAKCTQDTETIAEPYAIDASISMTDLELGLVDRVALNFINDELYTLWDVALKCSRKEALKQLSMSIRSIDPVYRNQIDLIEPQIKVLLSRIQKLSKQIDISRAAPFDGSSSFQSKYNHRRTLVLGDLTTNSIAFAHNHSLIPLFKRITTSSINWLVVCPFEKNLVREQKSHSHISTVASERVALTARKRDQLMTELVLTSSYCNPHSQKNINRIIGQNLRDIRMEKQISQKAIGRLLCCEYQQVQKYENGTDRLSASQIVTLSVNLKVPTNDFLDMTESKLS